MKKRKKKYGGNFKNTAISRRQGQAYRDGTRGACRIRAPCRKASASHHQGKEHGPRGSTTASRIHPQMLVTGNPSLTTESGTSIANTVLLLGTKDTTLLVQPIPIRWQNLQDLQQDLQAKEDYAALFPAVFFLPRKRRHEDLARWRQASSDIPRRSYQIRSSWMDPASISAPIAIGDGTNKPGGTHRGNAKGWD